MAVLPREFFCNVDFDIRLGMGESGKTQNLSNAITEYVHEIAPHFLFAGDPSDTVIVHHEIPHAFFNYLGNQDLDCSRVRIYPDISPHSILVPFGWDAHAETIREKYQPGTQPLHPEFDGVKQANSKVFSSRLAMEIDDVYSEIRIIKDKDFLIEFLTSCSDEELLLKTEFGHSGMGHKRIMPGNPLPLSWVTSVFEEGCQAVIVEPWMKRKFDIGICFNVSKKGSIRNIRFHELINTAEGSFAGILVENNHARIKPWDSNLNETVQRVGEELNAIGYFGPVNIDAFVWEDSSGHSCLRSLVEINARMTMADPVYGLWNKLDRRGTLLWRFYSSRKLQLPDNYEELVQQLDEVKSRIGGEIYLVSPLELLSENGPFTPKKVSVAFFADSSKIVNTLHNAFNRRFIKRSSRK
ncbi:MAG: hypothetical protein HQK83_10920 [Fibrobacteria bacterium]|nr:hypothetical protein [Fibrobacteria bacterium]